MRTLILLATGLSLLVGAAQAATPPINCKAASSEVEHDICAIPEYVAMDREIAALYDRGLAIAQGAARHDLVEGQRAFLKRREGCSWAAHHSAHPGVAVDECIRAAFEGRVAALRHFVDTTH